MSFDERIIPFLDVLRRTQYLPPDEMAGYQDRLLERLVRHAAATTDFYRAEGRLSSVLRNDRFVRSGWSDIPLLTRADVQQSNGTLFAASTPDEAGSYTEHRSSGSTGAPVQSRFSELARVADHAQNMRRYEALGLDWGRTLAGLVILPAGENEPQPKAKWTRWNPFDPQGRFLMLHMGRDVGEQCEWLARERPNYVWTYPSNAAAIADAFATGQYGRSSVSIVLTMSEVVTPEIRARIHDGLGARVADGYACQETGLLAFECPEASAMHLCSETNLVELLDDNGHEVAPGELGRVVVTSFYNQHMPLIRYAVGDYAIKALNPCICGRTLPTLERIAGRQRNVFTLSDGRKVMPLKIPAVAAFFAFSQCQLVQTHADRIEFRYTPPASPGPADAGALDRFFKEQFGPTVITVPVQVAEIRRGPGGKYEDAISLVL